jgi:hypothetical protein
VSAYKAALLAAICAEADRRKEVVSSVKPYDPDLDLYDLQRTRVGDPSRWQAWPAGRRSGKTNAAEKLLIKVGTAQERVQVYYVSTSIKRAVATVWDELVEVNRSRKLGGVPNYSVHTLTFGNGSKVVVTGVESKAMANDLRGRPRIALWFIDECQDWPEELLRYFYDNVVYPSLADVKGRVVLAGTGGKPRGFWYEVATGKVANDNPGVSAGLEFTRFDAWTPLQNPHLPEGEAKGLIAKACRERGGDESLPSIQREFSPSSSRTAPFRSSPTTRRRTASTGACGTRPRSGGRDSPPGSGPTSSAPTSAASTQRRGWCGPTARRTRTSTSWTWTSSLASAARPRRRSSSAR